MREIINNHQEITITEHGHPVVLMTPFSESPKSDIQKAIFTIKELRACLPTLSIQDILEMRESVSQYTDF